ncbi:hypothetical protein PENTCL1PPCAC_15086, partial [Pristionchus entomophagus]
IIPHTTDVDFCIRSEEYSRETKITRSLIEKKSFTAKILKPLMHKKSPYHLFRIYGLPDDSYELAVTVKKVSPRERQNSAQAIC